MKVLRTRWVLRAAVLALGAIAIAPLVADAILVSPHAVFISHEQRTGEVFLVNQGDRPEEVSVEFQFGFPATDSLGNIGMQMIADPGPEHPSAAGWLRAFPRRARVEPGQRQRVRIQATPPADLPDGEYWSRLIVASRAAQEPIAAGGDSAVRAGVTLELRTITSVMYRKGPVRTGVRLDGYSAAARGETLEAWVGLTREGNAAYLGEVTLELLDAGGKVVQTVKTPIAVYYSMNRRFELPVGDVPPGVYRLRLFVSTEREDLDARVVLPAAPIERVADVEIS